MTDEQMRETIRFILEQQAQTATNLQRLEEAQTRAEGRSGRLEGAVAGGVVNMLDRLTRTQERLVESQELIVNKVTELAEAQKQTDERLNALIDTVERFIDARRNGNTR